MYRILTLMIVFSICSKITMAQFGYKIIKDEKKGGAILVGEISEKIIDSVGEYEWFAKGTTDYEPDSNDIKNLKKIIAPYRFVVFAGTWCGDTQDLLPKFYKTIQQLNFNKDYIKLYGVDRNKKALNIDSDLYHIEYVPTFIIYKGNREVARIIESVNDSIEADLLKILSRDIDFNKE